MEKTVYQSHQVAGRKELHQNVPIVKETHRDVIHEHHKNVLHEHHKNIVHEHHQPLIHEHH